jgi:hypothetical protein
MHTYNLSSQDAANDSTSVGAPDGQALPIYVKGKEVIAGTRAARRTERQAARKNRDAVVDGPGWDRVAPYRTVEGPPPISSSLPADRTFLALQAPSSTWRSKSAAQRRALPSGSRRPHGLSSAALSRSAQQADRRPPPKDSSPVPFSGVPFPRSPRSGRRSAGPRSRQAARRESKR